MVLSIYIGFYYFLFFKHGLCNLIAQSSLSQSNDTLASFSCEILVLEEGAQKVLTTAQQVVDLGERSQSAGPKTMLLPGTWYLVPGTVTLAGGRTGT